MSLLTAHVTLGAERHRVDYDSVDEAMADEPLARLLDDGAEVILWAGPLRLTGRPIRSSRELREALVSNAGTILRRTL